MFLGKEAVSVLEAIGARLGLFSSETDVILCIKHSLF